MDLPEVARQVAGARGGRDSVTSTADPIAWVSSGRRVSPSTKLLSAVSKVVVVIVIGYSSLQASATKTFDRRSPVIT
jgi:hypothetical protein